MIGLLRIHNHRRSLGNSRVPTLDIRHRRPWECKWRRRPKPQRLLVHTDQHVHPLFSKSHLPRCVPIPSIGIQNCLIQLSLKLLPGRRSEPSACHVNTTRGRIWCSLQKRLAGSMNLALAQVILHQPIHNTTCLFPSLYPLLQTRIHHTQLFLPLFLCHRNRIPARKVWDQKSQNRNIIPNPLRRSAEFRYAVYTGDQAVCEGILHTCRLRPIRQRERKIENNLSHIRVDIHIRASFPCGQQLVGQIVRIRLQQMIIIRPERLSSRPRCGVATASNRLGHIRTGEIVLEQFRESVLLRLVD